jgi:hypothetical protein
LDEKVATKHRGVSSTWSRHAVQEEGSRHAVQEEGSEQGRPVRLADQLSQRLAQRLSQRLSQRLAEHTLTNSRLRLKMGSIAANRSTGTNKAVTGTGTVDAVGAPQSSPSQLTRGGCVQCGCVQCGCVQ